MTLEIATHRSTLLRILKDIFTDTTLGTMLGFKGGGALYLFYNLGRFSVDLDFDLLASDKEDIVFEKLKNILKEYGAVVDARKKRYSFFYVLSYTNKIQHAYNIKIEVNLRDFGSTYEVKSYLGIPMKVMVQADMAAHKLVAMIERIGKSNRDIFDVWFFLKNNWPINEKIITKRTGLPMQQFWHQCIKQLESMSNRSILSGIGELLDTKQKAWVKEHLRSEVIFLITLKMDVQT